MSLEFGRLRDAYRRAAADEIAASGDSCPAPEAVADFATGGGKRKERKRILSHLARCGPCAGEAQVFARLHQEIDETVRAAGPVRPFPLRFLESLRGAKPWWARPVTIGGLAILLLGLSYLFLLRPGRTSSVWRGNAEELRLVAPVGETADAGSWEFDWRPYPGASSYTVEVFDRALSPAWKSDPLPLDHLSPPASLLAALRTGGPYFWSVSARLGNGLVIKSGLTEFSLKR